MRVLSADRICKSFAGQQIIKDFSFGVDAGEVVVLEGRSGTGKTTLMRIINNLEQADSGSLAVCEQHLFIDGVYQAKADIKKYQQQVGMVFQNFALFPHLTVLENLLLAPRYLDLAKDEALEAKAKTVLESLDIAEKIDAMPATLSGGQKQRVAVARAIMLEPKLLCFDEPTSALDQVAIENIIAIIKDLKRSGMAVFIISHDVNFARSVADTLLHTQNFL